MANSEFTVDLRDQHFVLFEQFEVQNLPGDRYADFDQDLYAAILDEAAKFAKETIAPINASGDEEGGCRFEDGKVFTPKGYKAAYKQFCEAGWGLMGTPEEFGGQGLPIPVALACVETFTGASAAFMMYPGLTNAAANLLREMGTDWMKEVVLPKMLSGEWAGTMCLTEPQAGSAVGDVRSKAVPLDDGTYRLEGTKIFVSSGDQDLTSNIVHIMLARTPDAPSGIKGLSLFLVPKVRINPDGSLGETNDMITSGIEHKMGIKGSSTATLSIGDNGGAQARLIGREGEGIMRMLHMMNEARIAVAVQSYADAANSYHGALDYAKTRIQGTSFKEFKNADARRVPIIEHPDVARMLLHCRAQTDGMRALGMMLAYFAEGHETLPDGDPNKEVYDNLLQVLTPVAKSWCSDQCFEVAETALQVYGGYGYCSEYPAEQHVRDSKIFSIYEGTNGIQALDLVGRKMGMKAGAAFMQFMGWVNEGITTVEEVSALAPELAALKESRDHLGAATMHLMQLGMKGDQEMPVLHACDMLNLVGDVTIANLLGRQAAIAWPKLSALADDAGVSLNNVAARQAWLQENDEAKFYMRKIDNLRYFAHQFLPRIARWSKAITNPDRTTLEAVL